MAFVLCVIIIISAAPTVFAATNDFSMIDDILVIDDVFIEFGNTSSTLTLDPFGYGPCSFAIKNNKIYVLDTQANAIKVYNFAGTYLNSFSYPEYLYAIDMEVCGDFLYIMCDNEEIYCADTNAESITWESICTYSENDIACLVSEGNTVYARSWEGSDLVLGGVLVDSAIRSASCASIVDSTMAISKSGVTYNVALKGTPVGTYILKTVGSATYILEQEALLGIGFCEMRIGKYVDGTKVATALLTSVKDYQSFVPYKKVYVTDDGNVYQLISAENGMRIRYIPWVNGEKTEISDSLLAEDAAILSASAVTTITSATSLATRATALERAKAMCDYTWQYNVSSHYTPSTSTTLSPEHLGSTSGTQTGIPYCWGGMNGLNSTFISGTLLANQINFITAISNYGMTAGNIKTTNASGTPIYYQSSTAGVDCSGFICQAYQIPSKESCDTLISNGYAHAITWAKVEPGDVCINSSHTFMILEVFTSSSGQITKILTCESTTEGSEDKAKYYSRLYSDVLNVYDPYMIY